MTGLRLKNSYTKTIEPFVPLDPQGRVVRVYSCGPTVYSYAHIGNFRSFLVADLLRRVLERQGYVVKHVMNITDVGHMTQDHLADAEGEDKLANAARELGWDPYKVAEHFESAFVADAKALRLRNYAEGDPLDPAVHPRATRHVPEMLAMIQQLIDGGYAYVDGQGQVYFEIEKFPEYGRLSGKVLDDLIAGARVAVRDEKRDPRDFALWKVDDKHLMQWDPHSAEGWPADDWRRYRELLPNGIDARVKRGFPGWHIECSAMASAHLGDALDVHTGGEDNVFPHHECEIAQSVCAARARPAGMGAAQPTFARTWLHGRHLLVNGRKMSKSSGTFFTVRDLLDPRASGKEDIATQLEQLGFAGGKVPAAVLRFALMSGHFTQQLNFTFDLLVQAAANVKNLQETYDRLRDDAALATTPTRDIDEASGAQRTAFDAALADNLNVPEALAAVFAFVSAVHRAKPAGEAAALALRTLEDFDVVFDVLDRAVRSGVVRGDRLAGDAFTEPAFVTWAAGRGAFVDKLRAGELPAAAELPKDAPALVEALVVLRQQAKKAKDYARADAIRKLLADAGVLLEDSPAGVRWKVA